MESTGRWFPAGRSRGVTVAIDGLAAFVWFGWGQAAAPSWLVVPFAVDTGLGVLLAVAGVVLAWRSPGPLPAMRLQNPTLRPLGALLVAVAAAALITGLASSVAPSTVTGAGAGLSLLGFGLATLMARDRDGLAASRGKPHHSQFLLFG